MGIYIHYDGKARREDIPAILDGIENFVRPFGWRARRLSNRISGLVPNRLELGMGPTKLTGVDLIEDSMEGIELATGDGCRIEISFDQEGKIGSFHNISSFLEGTQWEGETLWLPRPLWACVTDAMKTHRQLCTLLKFLEATYQFDDWEVSDTTGYYETGNELKLGEENLIQSTLRSLFQSPGVAKSFLTAAGVIDKDTEVKVLDRLPDPPEEQPKPRNPRDPRPN